MNLIEQLPVDEHCQERQQLIQLFEILFEVQVNIFGYTYIYFSKLLMHNITFKDEILLNLFIAEHFL